MVEMAGLGGGLAYFPAVYFDGVTKTKIGNIAVYPSLDFERFQALLSHNIGISPNQFTVHLSSPESDRNIPITAQSNFTAISRQKSCTFVVVPKRSRRERRRRNFHPEDPNAVVSRHDSSAPPMILRRDAPGGELGFVHRRDSVLSDRVKKPDFDRPEFLFTLFGVGGPDPKQVPDPGRLVTSNLTQSLATCEECSRANESGQPIGFHCCVNDKVVFQFRSRAGPVTRPQEISE